MFDLTFLGTSASVPSPERNHPGLLISAGRKRILVDCGEGTQRQLLRSGSGFRRLRRLLLTHGHLDHVLGIPGLLSTLGLQKSSEGMTVNGGARTLRVVADMLAGLWGEGRAPIPLELAPLTPGQRIDEGDFTIDCFPVEHRDTDSLGFIFKAAARRHLRPDRLSQLGIPDGPVRKVLAAGVTVTLEGGRTIDPEDVLGPVTEGTKLVVIGDAGTTTGLVEPVRDADALVIEATFLERDATIARTHGHLTAAEAATLAVEAHVRRLILTHISGRYPVEDILAEAKGIFPATVVAADLDRHLV
jgi:ribonuclease Z